MRVLFIAYHFPPIGGAGSQRSQKFVRYLGEFGVEPVVIAGPAPSGRDRWEPADASLASELPASASIYRPDRAAPATSRLDAARRRLMLPTTRELWWQEQIRHLGGAALRRHRVDAIFVTLSPYEGLAAAVDLGETSGLPVVADLRDPWALDEVRLYPSALHRGVDRRRMGRLLGRCDLVIANTDEAAAALAAEFAPLADRLRVLPNGFDAADFAGVEDQRPTGDEVRIVHTGYLHSALGLAQQEQRRLRRLLSGSLSDVNLLTRSHFYLLRAVDELGDAHPALADRVRIVLAGVLSETDVRLIEASPVGDQVDALGYVTHREAIEQMLSADILFLPMHDLPPGVRSRIVPGKTYEYLAANRPILAAVPDGDAKDLVLAHGGTVVAPTDTTGIRDAIVDLAERGRRRTAPPQGLEAFERRALAARLADYLAQIGPPASG